MEGSIVPSVPAPATLPSSAASTPTAVGPEFATTLSAPCEGSSSQSATVGTVQGAVQRMPGLLNGAGPSIAPSRLRMQVGRQSDNGTAAGSAVAQNVMETQQPPQQYHASNGWQQAAAQAPIPPHQEPPYPSSAEASLPASNPSSGSQDADTRYHSAVGPPLHAMSQQLQQAYTWQQQQQLNIPTWQQQQQGWSYNRSHRESSSRGRSHSPRGRRRQQPHHQRSTPRSSSLHNNPQPPPHLQQWPQQQLHQQPMQPQHLRWHQQQYDQRLPWWRNHPPSGQAATPWLPQAADQQQQQQQQYLAPSTHHQHTEQPNITLPPPPPPVRLQQWPQQHTSQQQPQLQPHPLLQHIETRGSHGGNSSHTDEAHMRSASGRQLRSDSSRLQEPPHATAHAAAESNPLRTMLSSAVVPAAADAEDCPPGMPHDNSAALTAPAADSALPPQHQQPQDQGHVAVQSHRISHPDTTSEPSDDVDVWFDGSYNLRPQQREQYHAAMTAAASRYEHEHHHTQAHYHSGLPSSARAGAPAAAGQINAAAGFADPPEALYPDETGQNSTGDFAVPPRLDVVQDYIWDVGPPDWRALGLLPNDEATVADNTPAAMGGITAGAVDDVSAGHGGDVGNPHQRSIWHEAAWQQREQQLSPLLPIDFAFVQQQQQQQPHLPPPLEWPEEYLPLPRFLLYDSEDDATTPVNIAGNSSRDAMSGFPRYDPLAHQHVSRALGHQRPDHGAAHQQVWQQQQQQARAPAAVSGTGMAASRHRPSAAAAASGVGGLQQSALPPYPELPQLARVRTRVPARSSAALEDSPSAQVAQMMRQLQQQYIALQQQRYEATWQRLQLQEQRSQRRWNMLAPAGPARAAAAAAPRQQASGHGGTGASGESGSGHGLRPLPVAPLIAELPTAVAGSSSDAGSSNITAAHPPGQPVAAAAAAGGGGGPDDNSNVSAVDGSSGEQTAAVHGSRVAAADGALRELLEVASRSTMEVEATAMAAMAGSWQQQQQRRQQSGRQGLQRRRSYAWLYEAQRQQLQEAQRQQAVMNALIADQHGHHDADLASRSVAEQHADLPSQSVADQQDDLPDLLDAEPSSGDMWAPALSPDLEPWLNSSNNTQGSTAVRRSGSHAIAAAAAVVADATVFNPSSSGGSQRYQAPVVSDNPGWHGLPQPEEWNDAVEGSQPRNISMPPVAGQAAAGAAGWWQQRPQQRQMPEASQLRNNWSSSSIASPSMHPEMAMLQATPSAAAAASTSAAAAGSAAVLQTPHASGISNENFVTPEAAIMTQQQRQPPPVRQQRPQQQLLVSPAFPLAPLSGAVPGPPGGAETTYSIRGGAAAARQVSAGMLSPGFPGHSNEAWYSSSNRSSWQALQQRRHSQYRNGGPMDAARDQPPWIPVEEEGAHLLAAMAREEAMAREREREYAQYNAQLRDQLTGRRAGGVNRIPTAAAAAAAAGQRHVHPMFQTITGLGPSVSSGANRGSDSAANIPDYPGIGAAAAAGGGGNLPGLMSAVNSTSAAIHEQQVELDRLRQRLPAGMQLDLAAAALPGRRWLPRSSAVPAGLLTPYGRAAAAAAAAAAAGPGGLVAGPGADVMLRVLRRMGLDEPLEVDLANMFWGGGGLSYEQLIGLEDVRVVVPEHVLSQLPRRIVPLPDEMKPSKAATTATAGGPSAGADSAICPICQCDLAGNELVVQLPCKHDYHESCICEWLSKYKKTCPVCKAEVK